VKNFRKQFGAAALIATAALAGCDGRDDGTPDSGTPDPGCTGVCSTDAGTDGGTNTGTDAGTDAGTDGGTQPQVCPEPVNGLGPIGQIKATSGEGQRHKVEGLVVTAIDFPSVAPDAGFAQTTQFWAVNPCFPKEGMYIDRFFNNPNGTYFPRVGDIITVDGLFRHYSPTGANTPTNIVSYRSVLKDTFGITVTNDPGDGKITVTKTGERPRLPDNETPAGFGASNKGTVKANADFEGARVHIPGPLTITSAQPLALKQRPFDPANNFYSGFELTGGILVANNRTFSRCDFRRVAEDGGTVTFPNGVRGVWDTYTNVQCAETGTNADGGTTCKRFANGGIPGTLEDGGIGMVTDYTYVLYPLNCDVDLSTDGGMSDAGQ
jgi:hypothetical protein